MSRLYYISSLAAITISIIFLFPPGILPADDGGKLPFEPGDTLEEIRYKIDYNGYDFTVSENHISRMSREEKDNLLGRHRPRFTGKKTASTGPGPLIDLMGKEALPSSFDWRSYNGHSYIGPILDQGNCGACYAFGAAAAAEGTYNWANGLYDGNRINFSEAFIAFCLSDHYSQYFDGCSGSDWDYYELTALIQYGICLASSYPYTDYEQSCRFSSYPPLTKFQSWHRVACLDIDAIKTAIMTYGVVDAAVAVDQAFEDYNGGIYQNTATDCPGDAGDTGPECYYTSTDHAISLVGWNDNGGDGYWILRNSWGTDWGEDGYMRIKYTSARVACEVAYLVYGSDYRVLAGGDYNGDGRDDIAIFRPSSGLWSVRGVTRCYFGGPADIPVPGDYAGNLTTSIAIYRPSSGLWAVRNAWRAYFGSSSDIPIPADYTGTGRCNLGIYRPSTGLWAVAWITRCYYGGSSDIPIPGDYNGDNTAEPGIFRAASGLWSIRGVTRLYFGGAADTPVPGWYTGTRHYSPGIFRASSGLWAIRDVTRCYFGGSSDQPVPADFNSPAGDDLAIFRPTSGLWAIKGYTRCYFGQSGDIPVTR